MKIVVSKLERQNLDLLCHDTWHATWDQINQATVSKKHLSKNNDAVKQRWKTMNMDEKIYKTIGNQVLSQRIEFIEYQYEYYVSKMYKTRLKVSSFD